MTHGDALKKGEHMVCCLVCSPNTATLAFILFTFHFLPLVPILSKNWSNEREGNKHSIDRILSITTAIIPEPTAGAGETRALG